MEINFWAAVSFYNMTYFIFNEIKLMKINKFLSNKNNLNHQKKKHGLEEKFGIQSVNSTDLRLEFK